MKYFISRKRARRTRKALPRGLNPVTRTCVLTALLAGPGVPLLNIQVKIWIYLHIPCVRPESVNPGGRKVMEAEGSLHLGLAVLQTCDLTENSFNSVLLGSC